MGSVYCVCVCVCVCERENERGGGGGGGQGGVLTSLLDQAKTSLVDKSDCI